MDYIGKVTSLSQENQCEIFVYVEGKSINKKLSTDRPTTLYEKYLHFSTMGEEEAIGEENIVLTWEEMWSFLASYNSTDYDAIIATINDFVRTAQLSGDKINSFIDTFTNTSGTWKQSNLEELVKCSIEKVQRKNVQRNPFTLSLLSDNITDDKTYLQKYAYAVLPIILLHQKKTDNIKYDFESLELDTTVLYPKIVEKYNLMLDSPGFKPNDIILWDYISQDILSVVEAVDADAKKNDEDESIECWFSSCPASWINWIKSDEGREKKYYKSFLDISENYSIEKIENLVSNAFVFDLEVRQDSEVREYAFSTEENKIISETKSNNKLSWDKFSEAYSDFLKGDGVIVGHNIRNFDFKYIPENIISNGETAKEHIWDTLEVEVALEYHSCYKLKTKHKAEDDVKLTRALFEDQVGRILQLSPDKFSDVKCIIPTSLSSAIEAIRCKKIDSYRKFLKNVDFFYPQKGRFNIKIPAGPKDNPIIFIAPRHYWKSISSSKRENICFIGNDNDIFTFVPFDNEEVRNYTPQGDGYIYELAMKDAVENHQIPCISLLPDYIITGIKGKIAGYLESGIIKKINSANVFCVDPNDKEFAIDKLKKQHVDIGSATIISIGKELWQITQEPASSIPIHNDVAPDDKTEYPHEEKGYIIDKECGRINTYCPIVKLTDSACVNNYNIGEEQNLSRITSIELTDDSNLYRFSNYWVMQDYLLCHTHTKYPKVLLVNNQVEFDEALNFYNTIYPRKNDSPFVFHEKINRRFEILCEKQDDSKAYFTLAKISEITDCDYRIGNSYSFFINNLAISRLRLIEKDLKDAILYALKDCVSLLDSFCGNANSDYFIIDQNFKSLELGDIHIKKGDDVSITEDEYNNAVEKCSRYFQYDIQPKDAIDVAQSIVKSSLFEYQSEAIQKFCSSSERNTFLTIVPTGGGKSLIYQSLVLSRLKKENNKAPHSLTLVITPLQALMKDQYQELVKVAPEYKSNFAYLNSDTDEDAKKTILGKLEKGELSLLFIAPERLRYDSFIKRIERAFKRINSIIFDEAHCISEWGLDFRPDYLYAARKIVEYRKLSPSIRYMLLSATISKSTLKELEYIFGEIPEDNITRSQQSTIPIKEKIKPKFENLDEFEDLGNLQAEPNDKTNDLDESRDDRPTSFDEKIKNVYEAIFNNKDFNPNRLLGSIETNGKSWSPSSKVLIFTQTRLDAENGAHILSSIIEEHLKKETGNNADKDVLSDVIGHIDYYHAGMTKKQKDNKYLRFKIEDLNKYNNEKIEDGRNSEVIDGDSIKILFATKAFGMGMNIKNIHLIIHLTPPMYIEDYLQEVGRACRDEGLLDAVCEQYGNKNEVPAICLFTKKDIDTIKNRLNKELQWRHLAATWDKIKDYIDNNYGNFQPENEYLVDLNILKGCDYAEDDHVATLLQHLNWYETPIWGGIQKTALLKTSTKCSGHYEVGISNEIPIENMEECSFKRLYEFVKNHLNPDRMGRACFDYADVIRDSKVGITNKDNLDSLLRRGVALDFFEINYVHLELVNNEYNLREIKYFINGEQLCALTILSESARSAESAGHESAIDKAITSRQYSQEHTNYLKWIITKELVQDYSDKAKFYKLTIDELEQECKDILCTIAKQSGGEINFPDLFQDLKNKGKDISDEFRERTLNCILLLTSLHYIDITPFSYDCIKIQFVNTSGIDSHTPPGKEFECAYKLFDTRHLTKERKVEAMRKVCRASKDEDRIEIIKKYMEEVQDEEKLKEFLGEDNENIAKERLSDIINKRLSEKQREIYNEKEDSNICINAGAGSGKTRVLIVRVLKYLIELRCANENEILVLAYNNKIKDELRKKLKCIMAEIGMEFTGKNVITFHTLAGRYCPSVRRDKLKLEEWEPEFRNYLLKDGNDTIPSFKYILVDEFQDVTDTRMEILKLLSRRSAAKLFVVGDVFQSIYDFDKENNQEKRDPNYYFDAFRKFSKTFQLNENHRSYQEIIDRAYSFIKPLNSWKENPLYEYGRKEEEGHPGSVIEIGENWEGRFDEIYKRFLGLLTENKDAKMAILFKTNAEAFAAYRWIQNNKKDVIDKVYTKENILFYRTREFFEFRKRLMTCERSPNAIFRIHQDIINEHSNYCENFLILAEDIANAIKDESCPLPTAFDEMSYELKYDSRSKSEGQITIATIHSVKGLDYDLVVVPECHMALYENNIAEERRLFYVACTRAKKVLYYPNGAREKNLIEGATYTPDRSSKESFWDPSHCKVYLNYLCGKVDNIGEYEKLKVGDEVIIGNDGIIKTAEGKDIGELKRDSPIRKAFESNNREQLQGVIRAIYIWTRKDAEAYDEKNNTTYSNSKYWPQDLEYVYYPDFELK